MNRKNMNTLLEKTKSISVVRLTRQQKAKMMVGSIALKLAKVNNDPLYKKYLMYKTKMLSVRNRILRKYGPKAMSVVRKQVGTAQKTW